MKKCNRLKVLIADINKSSSHRVEEYRVNQSMSIPANSLMLKELSGWIGALIVRSLLFKIGASEHRVFKWRIENKFIQYLIISYYCPGYMPKTFSLTALLSSNNWVNKIRSLVRNGYFIKSTLGSGSALKNYFDRTSDFEEILKNHNVQNAFEDEKWIVQKRLNLRSEFRVHTLGQDVLYGLTLRTKGDVTDLNFTLPQSFVQTILQKLPLSLKDGLLIGWDIGITDSGKCYIIEANFTGYHPIYQVGFQTTGYVDTPPLGSVICALIYVYMRNKYGIIITSIDHILHTRFDYIDEFCFYISALPNEYIKSLHNARGCADSAYIFVHPTFYNYIIKFVSFIQIANHARNIHLIADEDLLIKLKSQFRGNLFKFYPERSLLTDEEYNLRKNQAYSIKKKAYYSRLTSNTVSASRLFF